jgi:C-terminal processing protease CtpA/Prc
MKLITTSVWKPMALLAACLVTQAPAAQPAKFQEVFSVISSNLTDVSATELDQIAIKGLLGQLPGRTILATNVAQTSATAGLLGQTNIFDDAYAYLRVGVVGSGLAEQMSAAFTRMNGEKKIKGMVLDLRFASGQDYASAVAVLDQFVTAEKPQLALGGVPLRSTKKDKAVAVPVAVLVNHQTSAAAEALAALLRQNQVGLILGATTAGEAYLFKEYPLTTGQTLRIANGVIRLSSGEALSAAGVKPDIAVEVSAADEKSYFTDPFKDLTRTFTASRTNTTTLSTTNTPRRRINEAELVRRQKEGQNPDEEVATGKLRDLEPPKPSVQDPALARALDLLKGLAVVKQFRTP